jgi:hypothetical protein
MTDFILITGDKAIFNPSFGTATVVVQPGTLTGTGKSNVGKKAVCVQGDESQLIVPGCQYMTPQYSIPGVGVLSIDGLGDDQIAKKTNSGGKAVLLKGSSFKAKFQVTIPAQQPQPSGTVPDAVLQYSGTGNFVTMNVLVKGN